MLAGKDLKHFRVFQIIRENTLKIIETSVIVI